MAESLFDSSNRRPIPTRERSNDSFLNSMAMDGWAPNDKENDFERTAANGCIRWCNRRLMMRMAAVQ